MAFSLADRVYISMMWLCFRIDCVYMPRNLSNRLDIRYLLRPMRQKLFQSFQMTLPSNN